MKCLALSLVAVALLAVVSSAQEAESKQIELYLKSGDVLSGAVTKADEDGVKLDIGDGIELFISWDYTRGDKHYDLRKTATDFSKIKSVLKLADFCHTFAMDTEESYVLVAALKLQPENKEVLARLKELPKVEGLEIPGEESGPVEPEPDVKPEPEPDKPLPPATRKQAKVFVKMQSKDDTAETWMTEHFTEMNYDLGTEKDHEVKVQIEINLKLIKNPEFMGAELYAIYDGDLTWKLYKTGEKTSFADKTVKIENVRRDTRDEARARIRTELCEESFTQIHNALEKLR